jgi:hypothetical protein
MRRFVLLLAPSLLAGVATACGAQCDRTPDEPPVVFNDGFTDQAALVYMSSRNTRNPFAGPWLDFPPGRTYRFPHHLGGVPRDPEVWLSFSASPSTFVPAAGNQATWENLGADHADLRNDTCSEVFVMVRLSDPALSRDAGAADAATD